MAIAELHYVNHEIWCRTPYSAAFVAALKYEIPFPYRRWEPAERVWIIDTVYEAEILALCETHFDAVRTIHRETESTTSGGGDHYATLYILPNAPAVVVEAAYRALAKLWHPDLSNEPDAVERMKQVNLAYQQIQRERR